MTAENPVPTKKYSKNKVTRTRNVLSDPPNDKYGHRSLHEWKKVGLNQVVFQEAADKSNISKFITDPGVFRNNETEKKSEVEVLPNNFSHKHSPLIRNSKRGNNDSGVGPSIDINTEKSMSKNYDFESEEDRKFIGHKPMSDRTYTRALENKNSNRDDIQNLDKSSDRRDVIKKNTVKKIPGLINIGVKEVEDVSNKVMKNKKVSIPPQSSNNHITSNGNNVEDVKLLNISDNSNFPALTGGNVTTALPLLSYSAVAKRVVPVNAMPVPNTEREDMPKVIQDKQLTEDEKRILKKRQKKEKRKMKVKQKKQEARMGESKQDVPEKRSEKALDREVTLDLSDMFSTLLKVSSEKKSQKLMKLKKTTGIYQWCQVWLRKILLVVRKWSAINMVQHIQSWMEILQFVSGERKEKHQRKRYLAL